MQLIHDLLLESAKKYPGKTALCSEAGSITYQQLWEETTLLLNHFIKCGIRRGDRIGILLDNQIQVVKIIMAASRAGAIFFVLNQQVKDFHLDYIIKDAAPKIFVTTEKRKYTSRECNVITIEALDNVSPAEKMQHEQHAASDYIALIYTSGSTGMPKAVVSTHDNILFATAAIQSVLALKNTDIIGNFLPFSFDYGLYQVFLSLYVGATLFIGKEADAGPPILKLMNKWNITVLPVIPNILEAYLRLSARTGANTQKLRIITNTGAHLSGKLINAFRMIQPHCAIFLMYGLTECKRVSILPYADLDKKPGSVGLPLPGTECYILDGELIVKGRHVMAGYWNAPALTMQKFREGGRALYTGDICTIDQEGYIYFHGRKDDIFKHNGYRVSTLEIEAAALNIPGILDAAVIPPEDGTGPALFAVSALSTEQIIAELKARLESYKMPAAICLLESLPHNAHGKTDKGQLKKLFKKL